MIRIDSLTKSFSSQTVFSGLSLDIPLGKTTVITGPSGCGKTTLLRIIAGIDNDYKGTVSGAPKSISFIFQEDRLLPWRSARGNIEFVLKDVMESKAVNDAVTAMINAVRLSGSEGKTPSELSGGMKRRVAMARAYCFPAELYLFDEPFKGFDSKLREDMVALFEELFIDTGKSVVLVTHDEDLKVRFGKNVIDLGTHCVKDQQIQE